MGAMQQFTPEQITAMLFTKLRGTAESALKTKIVDCVVSVSFGIHTFVILKIYRVHAISV